MLHAREKIQKAVIELLKTKAINQLKVTQICRIAQVNRSTFYDNYEDINDMVYQLREYIFLNYQSYLEKEVHKPFLAMLENIQKYKDTYKLFFKLSLDQDLLKYFNFSNWFVYPSGSTKYDYIFVQAAIRSVIKIWIENDCDISPQELNKFITNKLNLLGLKIKNSQQFLDN